MRFPIRQLGATVLALCVAASSSADTFRIELDYMVDDDHSHEPDDLVIDAVVQMFACQGHTLIIEVSDALPHYDVMPRDPNDCSVFWGYDGQAAAFGALRDTYYDHDGEGGWHYCIFGHRYEDSDCDTTGSSGLGQRPGEFFIVTLGGFTGQTGTMYEQAATLAHEFGHNLGLRHCGTMDCGSDDTTPTYVGPYVPNLASVMSYQYQLAGVRSNMLALGLTFDEALLKDIDYSHGRMCSVNEDSLDEVRGTQMVSTDWDCDGTLEPDVAQNINDARSGWCGAGGNRTLLHDYDEWSNIVDVTTLPRGARPAPDTIACITDVEWEQVQLELATTTEFLPPTLSVEPCFAGENVYIGQLLFAEAGTCNFPYVSIESAHDDSPADSVFYVRPGTYAEDGAVLLTKRGKYFCKTGSALFH